MGTNRSRVDAEAFDGGGVRQSLEAAGLGGGAVPASARHSASIAPVLLSDEQAGALLGVSVRKFHELRCESWMPKPIVLGPRLLRWSRPELEAAVAAMPRQKAPSTEPLQLTKARAARAGHTEIS